jgi:hypothetical protein
VRRSGEEQIRCDGTCPIVWIFDVTSPVRDTFVGFVPREGGSNRPACYSAFHWLLRSERVAKTPLERFHIAYSLSLMRGMMPSSRSPASVAAMIERMAPARRASTPPWLDPDLAAFRGHQLAVACAVKYACDHVIVVSIPAAPIDQAVREFAARRGVRILPVPASGFERSALERLAIDHNAPAPSHWEPPIAWCDRFVTDHAEAFEGL